jgi:hypothetical protein
MIAWVAGSVLAPLVADPALAADGGPGSVAPSYYEEVAAGSGPAAGSSGAAGLPAALSVVDAEGGVAYDVLASDAEGTSWQVTLELAGRRHERVDAVYDLVLALPLPADGAGAAAFTPEQWGITPREGSPRASVPLIYSGEKLVLRRNVGLERAWLPQLAGAADGLPDLAGTGYRFTLWDAIVRYDAGFGDRVQGVATLRYRTAGGVGAPDPADARLAAFLIVWIPELDPTVKPYTVRLDVRSPEAP